MLGRVDMLALFSAYKICTWVKEDINVCVIQVHVTKAIGLHTKRNCLLSPDTIKSGGTIPSLHVMAKWREE